MFAIIVLTCTVGASILIEQKWLSLANKNEFSELQKDNPFVISMGLNTQKELVV